LTKFDAAAAAARAAGRGKRWGTHDIFTCAGTSVVDTFLVTAGMQ